MSERYMELSVDIETLGRDPGSAVVSIGAIAFSEEKIPVDGTQFEVRVSLIDCIAVGLDVDRATAQWWAQKRAAREALETTDTAPLGVAAAVEALRDYVQAHCVEKPRVWMKGPDFDGVLLKAMAKAVGATLPWPYYMSRCVRTICDDVPEPERVQETDVAHSALDDAIHQAVWVRQALMCKQVIPMKED
jgi:hypothetical protein